MSRRWLWLALPAFALGAGAWAQDKDKDLGTAKRLVVYAKKTDKLSARLRAVQLCGGTLVGTTSAGGAVVKVPAHKLADAKKRLKEAGARLDKPPEKPGPAERLMLSYKKDVSDANLKKNGYQVLERHKHEGGVVLLVRPLKPLSAASVNALEKHPNLTHAELDKVVSVPPVLKVPLLPPLKFKVPNDPHFGKLWGMRNIQAPEAWKKGTNASAVVVAVIDTGVDLHHEDLKSHLVKGLNAINPLKPPMDDNGHGTHVAGTIGAIGNNNKGVAGVCWRVKIMPIKFLTKSGSGSLFHAIVGIDYARLRGARVMNNSWGGGSYSQALHDAILRANKKGILFVAAAGNNGTNNDSLPRYPSSYGAPNILAVAAIDENNNKAAFSCFGKKTVDLAAPGVAIFSTKLKSGPLSDPSGYGYLSGTSMATPHVSGAAALLLGRKGHTGDRAPQLKSSLMKHARKIAAMKGRCLSEGTLDITFLSK